MIKPDCCRRCSSVKLQFVKNNKVFDPDLGEEEITDTWVCQDCKTIHVERGDFNYWEYEIDTNKEYSGTRIDKWK